MTYHPYLPESLWLEIRPAFHSVYPNEAVVAVWLDGSWKHLENVSNEPWNEFVLTQDDSTDLLENPPCLLLHSHTNAGGLQKADAAPSDRDTEAQIATGWNWGITAVTGSEPLGCVYDVAYPEIWGPDAQKLPLEGRTYLWGVRDCWTLCWDFYATQGNALAPIPRVRQQGPHNKHPRAIDPFSYWAPRLGFERVTSRNDRQPGDLVLMCWRSSQLNHCAIYLGQSRYLQQHADRTSEITVWRDEEMILERTASQFWRLPDYKGEAYK